MSISPLQPLAMLVMTFIGYFIFNKYLELTKYCSKKLVKVKSKIIFTLLSIILILFNLLSLPIFFIFIMFIFKIIF